MQIRDKLRRLLALILAMAMCLSLLSASVWAADLSGEESPGQVEVQEEEPEAEADAEEPEDAPEAPAEDEDEPEPEAPEAPAEDEAEPEEPGEKSAPGRSAKATRGNQLSTQAGSGRTFYLSSTIQNLENYVTVTNNKNGTVTVHMPSISPQSMSLDWCQDHGNKAYTFHQKTALCFWDGIHRLPAAVGLGAVQK